VKWSDWVKLAGDLFAMTDARDDGVLGAWSQILKAQGTTPDEAADACRWLASNDPPEYRGAVLKALQARLKAASGEMVARRSSEAHDGPQCLLCGGTGRVWAADPDAYLAGKYHRVVLLCRCPLGRWMLSGMRDKLQEAGKVDRLPWTVDQYDESAEWCDVGTGEVFGGAEARRRMLAEMERRLAAEVEAAWMAREGDRARGRLARPNAFAAVIDRARRGAKA
jgi:hypothetical protein